MGIKSAGAAIVHTERQAMARNRQAVLILISAFRKERQLIKDLIKSRHTDGAVDGAAMWAFLHAVEDIYEELKEQIEAI